MYKDFQERSGGVIIVCNKCRVMKDYFWKTRISFEWIFFFDLISFLSLLEWSNISRREKSSFWKNIFWEKFFLNIFFFNVNLLHLFEIHISYLSKKKLSFWIINYLLEIKKKFSWFWFYYTLKRTSTADTHHPTSNHNNNIWIKLLLD